MKIGKHATGAAQTMTRCHFDDELRETERERAEKNATATAFWQINTEATTTTRTTSEDNLLLICWK